MSNFSLELGVIACLPSVISTVSPSGEYPRLAFHFFFCLNNEQHDEILSMGGHECILTHTKVSRCTMWRRVGVLVDIHRASDFPLFFGFN
jgi:hypothetical protein